jgi:hypothetical protein
MTVKNEPLRYGFDARLRSPPRKDKRGVDLISDALPFGRLWYGEPDAVSNAINYAKFYSRSHDAVIRVYDEAGNVIEAHEHAGDFKQLQALCFASRHARDQAAFRLAVGGRSPLTRLP